MIMPIAAVVGGLALLVWSADRFIEGAAAVARYFGMSALLIGMVIIGFGTSAPEMVVSAISATQGNPGIALGNAYGSNITNIALILGITAVLKPINLHSQILRKELPILSLVTGLAAYQLWDGDLTRMDAAVLLVVFAMLMGWTTWESISQPKDTLGVEVEQELVVHAMPIQRAFIWLFVGLILLIVSSRFLVWGAVSIAQTLGVSDLVIGLTVIAVGTSLPELASSIIAARKGEHDLAVGNIIGSNLFNTLAVVGIAGSIHPLTVPAEVMQRDIPVMATVTLAIFVFGYGFRGPSRLNRVEGGILLLSYVAYTVVLIMQSTA